MRGSLQPGAPGVAERAAPRWRVRLLGAAEAEAADGRRIVHWPTRAVALLLARLALQPHRVHSRDELVELLWPGAPPDVGRNRLRQALSTLKRLLDADDDDAPPVLLADRLAVRAAPGALACDALDFMHHAARGDAAAARALYQGELLPGFYDDWTGAERERLAMLYEALPEGPPQRRPAAAAAAPQPRGLPSYLTRPFGIDAACARLRALLPLARLVTVHGPGGSGKTRLATQALRELCADGAVPFRSVAFVPLLACSSAGQTLEAIAEALGAGGAGAAPARIDAALAGRPALLLMDNAEQLDADADAALATLLAGLPQLHLLVTSRRLLGIDGEVAFEADGLALPPPGAAAADTIAASPAVALFIDRAQAVRQPLALGAQPLAAIGSIVRLLGGMPLAIELAASRLRSLTPRELLEHLGGGGSPTLDLLARAAPAAADARHASMRHVVRWSWALLNAQQRGVMQALSIFGAPARLEAVAAVVDLPRGETGLLLDALHDLSLARCLPDAAGPTRWALLQPVREFAAEQQPTAQALAARHRLRRWLIDFALAQRGQGPAAVAAEMPHVHAAIVSAVADDAGEDALRLAVALRGYWDSDALPLSVLLALEQALQRCSVEPALASAAHELLALARCVAGFAAEAVQHASAAATAAPDALLRALALARWAWAAYFAGRYDADFDTALAEAESLAAASGDAAVQATVHRVQALIAANLRLDFERAEELSVRAQALYERAGQRALAHYALLNRVTMWAWRGRDQQGLAAMREMEATLLADGDWAGLMHCTRQQGRVLIRLRRWDDAVEAFRRSLRTCWQQQLMQGLAQGLLHLPEALLHGSRHDAETAARLQGFAVQHWDRLYPRLNPIEVRELRRARRMLRLRLSPASAEALLAAGACLALPDAVALALGDPPRC